MARRISAPAPLEMTSGMTPIMNANEVMRMGRSLRRAASITVFSCRFKIKLQYLVRCHMTANQCHATFVSSSGKLEIEKRKLEESNGILRPNTPAVAVLPSEKAVFGSCFSCRLTAK